MNRKRAMGKGILGLLICLVMAFGLKPTEVFAAQTNYIKVGNIQIDDVYQDYTVYKESAGWWWDAGDRILYLNNYIGSTIVMNIDSLGSPAAIFASGTNRIHSDGSGAGIEVTTREKFDVVLDREATMYINVTQAGIRIRKGANTEKSSLTLAGYQKSKITIDSNAMIVEGADNFTIVGYLSFEGNSRSTKNPVFDFSNYRQQSLGSVDITTDGAVISPQHGTPYNIAWDFTDDFVEFTYSVPIRTYYRQSGDIYTDSEWHLTPEVPGFFLDFKGDVTIDGGLRAGSYRRDISFDLEELSEFADCKLVSFLNERTGKEANAFGDDETYLISFRLQPKNGYILECELGSKFDSASRLKERAKLPADCTIESSRVNKDGTADIVIRAKASKRTLNTEVEIKISRASDWNQNSSLPTFVAEGIMNDLTIEKWTYELNGKTYELTGAEISKHSIVNPDMKYTAFVRIHMNNPYRAYANNVELIVPEGAQLDALELAETHEDIYAQLAFTSVSPNAPKIINRLENCSFNGYSKTATFSVTATANTALVYNWRYCLNGYQWYDISQGFTTYGATYSATGDGRLVLENLSSTYDNMQIECTVTGAGGSAYSRASLYFAVPLEMGNTENGQISCQIVRNGYVLEGSSNMIHVGDVIEVSASASGGYYYDGIMLTGDNVSKEVYGDSIKYTVEKEDLDTKTLKIQGIFKANSERHLIIGGEEVDMTKSTTGNGWSFNPSTNELTLTKATLTNLKPYVGKYRFGYTSSIESTANFGVYADFFLKIRLVGSSTISCTTTSTDAPKGIIFGLYGTKGFKFLGNGSLTVNEGSVTSVLTRAIGARGTVEFADNVTVKAYGTAYGLDANCTVQKGTTLVIKGSTNAIRGDVDYTEYSDAAVYVSENYDGSGKVLFSGTALTGNYKYVNIFDGKALSVAVSEKNFPDSVFRAYVKTNFDLNEDDALSMVEIQAAQTIKMNDMKAESLKGIEFLTNLKKLDVSNNSVAQLDLSNNNELLELNCAGNLLQELEISNLRKLVYLNCSYNRLVNLDVSRSMYLEELICNKNQLESLRFKGANLATVNCAENQLTALSVKNCPGLVNLHCGDNHLTSLDLSENKKLEQLTASGNTYTVEPNEDHCFRQSMLPEGFDITKVKLWKNATDSTSPWILVYPNTLEVIYTYDCGGDHIMDVTLYVPVYTENLFGKISADGKDTDKITIQLIEAGHTEPTYETVIAGNSTRYGFSNVEKGKYILKAMKEGCETVEYEISVESEFVVQDVELQIASVTVKYYSQKTLCDELTAAVKYNELDSYVLAAGPAVKGYVFLGWSDSDAADAKPIEKLTLKKYQAQVYLYAVYRPIVYSISFNGNGATSGSMAAVTDCEYGKKYVLPANAFKRTGYVFKGWNTKADGSATAKADGATVSNLASTDGKTVVLYAQWEELNTNLATPTITKLENASTGVKATWDAVEGAEMYRLMYKEPGGNFVTGGYTTGTSYTVKNLTSGVEYYFTVRCMTADKKTNTSDYDRVGTPITYIAAPALKKVENTSNGVKVTWDLSAGAELYKVMYKEASGSYKTAGYTTENNYTVTGLTAGVEYTFTVRCMTADKKTYTSSYNSTGLSLVYQPAAAKLATPVITKLENAATGVKATWDAVEGAEMYRLMYKEPGGSFVTGGYTTGTSYTVKNLTSGVEYYFTVRCMTADKKTNTSDYDRVGTPITYIAAPALQKVENASNGVKLTWNLSAGAELYKVMYKEAGGSYKTAGYTAENNYTVTGLTAGTEYTFTARCIMADKKTYTSSYDSKGLTLVYQPAAVKLATPVITKLENTNSGVKVTWGAVDGAEMYRLMYKEPDGSFKTGGYTTGTSYTVKDVTGGVTYAFTVRCMTADKKTNTSDYDKVGTSITYIAAPVLTKVYNTASGVKVIWQASAGAELYKVMYMGPDGTWKTGGYTTSTGYTVKNLTEGTAYAFTVRCMTADKSAYTSGYDKTGLSITYVKP